MLNETQFSQLLRNLCSLEGLLDERIHREFQQTGYDTRTRRMIEQRIDVHRLLSWVMSSLSNSLTGDCVLQIRTDLSAIQNSPLAESCWEIFSEHMPFRAFTLVGDAGCDKRDGVVPNQMMSSM